MRKVQITAVFWTLVIAIPLTALALSLAAYFTQHMADIGSAIATFSRETTIGARGWMMVLSERWPEIAGMIIGQIVILVTLVYARRAGLAENGNK